MIHSDLPWSMCGDGRCPCGTIYAADGEVQVGRLFGPSDIAVGVVPSAEAQRGNARLFKAVNLHNELVAALEAATAELKEMRTLDPDACNDLTDERIAACEAALAKAKGE